MLYLRPDHGRVDLKTHADKDRVVVLIGHTVGAIRSTRLPDFSTNTVILQTPAQDDQIFRPQNQ
jgi:hypothetical protein